MANAKNAPTMPPNVQGTIERLKLTDERFRHIAVTIHAETVSVGAAAYREEDRLDLARAIASIPGVERVVLENTTSASDPWQKRELRDLRIEERPKAQR